MSDPLFEMYRGDDYALNLTITDEDDSPIDLTGWRFSVTMKLSPEQSDDQAPVKVDLPEATDSGATQGLVNILLPHDQTEGLIPAAYLFDVQAEREGLVTTVVTGKAIVKGDITRRTV